MKTNISCIAGLLIGLALSAQSQEVIIPDFPSGVAESADPGIIRPYTSGLKAIADSLKKYPSGTAIVVGSADGGRYMSDHDAKNPGVALGRAHFMRNILIREFGVDSTQLLIQTKYSVERGAQFRFVSVRFARHEAASSDKHPSDDDLSTPSMSLPHPVPPQVKDPCETTGPSGLQVGIGAASSPYGGMPVVTGAIVWKKQVYVEGIFGHTIWNETAVHRGATHDIRNRMAGGAIIYFPFDKLPVGLYAGWNRIEEISQKYYSYLRMSEGPLFGLRAMPFHYLSITGAYSPTKERTAGNTAATPYTDEFFISATIHTLLGGGR